MANLPYPKALKTLKTLGESLEVNQAFQANLDCGPHLENSLDVRFLTSKVLQLGCVEPNENLHLTGYYCERGGERLEHSIREVLI